MDCKPNERAAYWLDQLRGMPEADRKEFCEAIPDLSKFEDDLMEAGCPLDEIDELLGEFQTYRNMVDPDPSAALAMALIEAIDTPGETSEVSALDDIKHELKPKFPTSVGQVNALTEGGGYGLTTVGGSAKVGKTLFAFGTAVEACKAGWRVVYLNAELDKSEAAIALARYCGGMIPPFVKNNFTLVNPEIGFRPHDAVARAHEALQFYDNRMLIVMDSINALAEFTLDGTKGRMDYWAANALWRNFAVRATRKSFGKIAFLCVSELNKDGGIKGGSLEYKADLVVRISADTSNTEYVDIDVRRSRSTASGELGKFRRVWNRGRFDAIPGSWRNN
jgi:predicted ATP-dependent serine protease